MKINDVSFNQDVIIKPIEARWFQIPHPFEFKVYLEGQGVVTYNISEGFLFDGRSGGPLIDFVAPNLGNQEELKSWIAHDVMFYDKGSFSFKEANEILIYQLKKYCGYGWFKRWLIARGVATAEHAFGVPIIGEKEFVNVGKIHIRHSDK